MLPEDVLGSITDNPDEEAAPSLLSRLVRVPSVSFPPEGNEAALQELIADRMWEMGMEVSRVFPNVNEEFRHHPAYNPEHCVKRRPNVWGKKEGGGGGRSLLLVSHSDTAAPEHSDAWPGGDPYSGTTVDGTVFGPGAGGGKAGLAAALSALDMLRKADLKLKGDVTVASVVDEEWLGCQGMLGLVLSGVNAEAALYLAGPEQCYSLEGAGTGCASLMIENASGEDPEGLLGALTGALQKVRAETKDDRGYADLLQMSHLEMTSNERLLKLMAKINFMVMPGQMIDTHNQELSGKLMLHLATDERKMSWMQGPRSINSWTCTSEDFNTVVASAATTAWKECRQDMAKPSGAFLLAEHGRIPTAVGGGRTEIHEGEPESLSAEKINAYTLFTALTIAEWCGIE